MAGLFGPAGCHGFDAPCWRRVALPALAVCAGDNADDGADDSTGDSSTIALALALALILPPDAVAMLIPIPFQGLFHPVPPA